MPETKLATFKVNADQWDSFLDLATDQGTTASALLKLFISRYLDGSIDLNQPQAPDNIDVLIDTHLEPIRTELAELRGKLAA